MKITDFKCRYPLSFYSLGEHQGTSGIGHKNDMELSKILCVIKLDPTNYGNSRCGPGGLSTDIGI